ncbi:carbon-nitrogen hydrolase family protein [bacterium]|nr:carbon-nitrogen hydrolase family protein [bacterium]
MKVTVCELNDNPDDFAHEWEQLAAHVKTRSSQLVLLPEMPFCTWFALNPVFEPNVWQSAVTAHEVWMERFSELAPAIVLGSRPVNRDEQRLNEGFVWEQQGGYRAAHHKYYLPDEQGFWEASWYSRGEGSFTPMQCGGAKIGFQICTELWSMEHARLYGREGVSIIVTPRATGKATLDKWLAGGRAAAIVSGAFSLSSNRAGFEGQPVHFGGQGWIVGPDGEVLGLTSREQPFITVEIDLDVSARAKQTYPRYVF